MTDTDARPAAVRALVRAAYYDDRGEVRKILDQLTLAEIVSVTMDLAKTAPPDVYPDSPYHPNGVRKRDAALVGQIVQTTAVLLDVDPAEVLSTSRKHRVTDARAVAAKVAHSFGLSQNHIGLCLNRDRSSISVALTRVEDDPHLSDFAHQVTVRVAAPERTS